MSAINYIEARLADAIRPHQDPQDQVLRSNSLSGEQEGQNNQKNLRPLLSKKNKIKVIKELLNFRNPFYKAACDYEIDTTNLSIQNIGGKIIKIYNQI